MADPSRPQREVADLLPAAGGDPGSAPPRQLSHRWRRNRTQGRSAGRAAACHFAEPIFQRSVVSSPLFVAPPASRKLQGMLGQVCLVLKYSR